MGPARDEVRVALAQIEVASLDPAANLERVTAAAEEAAGAGADLVLVPELANVGQVPAFDDGFASAYAERAEDAVPGAFTRGLAGVARRLGVHVVAGVAVRAPGRRLGLVNAAVTIGPGGEVLGVQEKIHPAGHERDYFDEGREVAVLDTDLGVLSAQICYDLYFPEVARTAGLRGAEILVGIANVTDRPEWPDRLAALAMVRAYENMQHVAVVNRVGEDHGRPFGGESVVAEPPGLLLARGPREIEAVVSATLRAEVLGRELSRRPVFEHRRPEAYDLSGPGRKTGSG